MLKGKFRNDRIPAHLSVYVKGGILYSVIDQNDIVFIQTETVLIPFRSEQVERSGENNPDALVELRTVDEFVGVLLENFELNQFDES
jgi:hypothetical protein